MIDQDPAKNSLQDTNSVFNFKPGPPGETAAERRARRRRTRWTGSEHDKTFIPGLPTVLPSTLTREQEEQYLREFPIALQHQIYRIPADDGRNYLHFVPNTLKSSEELLHIASFSNGTYTQSLPSSVLPQTH